MDFQSYPNLLVSIEERVATVTLNRPEQLNTTTAMLGELERIWGDLEGEHEVDLVILTGAGKAFSAGGDIRAMADRYGTPEGLRHNILTTQSARRLIDSILNLSKPLICAINGDAAGLGATLALLSDITVMADTARLGDPHVRVGLVAGDGGAVIWPLLIGPSRAKEFLMRGALVAAPDALRMGLVNHVVARDEVLQKASELAQEILRNPVWAVRWTKQSVNKWLKQQVELIFDASIAFEMLSAFSADHGEATKAATEKRAPIYTGF
ncbi:MAG TPA: enoyl-CoA hydratase-related protein [Bryobacteraceae bacterium]|jgi:enoyl-CoA hydratase/carnithine racemase|nr:enoyl-CoA hydratase-related protein [Bryobacteraceae bacterium]